MKPRTLSWPRVCIAWLAIWLVVLAAGAPTLTVALAPGPGAPFLEICSATGAPVGARAGADEAAGSDPAPSPPGARWHAACPFCLLHADRLAPPTVSQPWLAPPRDALRVRAATPRGNTPNPYRHRGGPRGPPILG